MAIITQSDNPNNRYSFPTLEVDEFLPIVKFKEPSRYVVEDEELVQSDEKVELSKHLDETKRKFTILQLTTEKQKVTLPFTIKKGSKASWDDDGYLEPKIMVKDESTGKIVESKDKTIKITSKKEITAKYDTKFEVKLEFTAKESKEFYLDFYANDDEKYFTKGEYENVFCGRLKVSFLTFDADVFRKSEIEKILIENEQAQTFNRTGSVVGNGYCINAADRGLGALLSDSKKFYSEPNLIAQGGNGIRLENSRARAKVIKSHGYIENFKEVKTDNYNSSKAPTKLATSLKELLKKDINNRRGHHVYYFSMHGEYHVMLLLIDFTNTNTPKFSILDQGYVDRGSSRNLDFDKIDKTFLALAKAFWDNKKKHAKNILLWKVKRN